MFSPAAAMTFGRKGTASRRFWQRVQKTDACWLWLQALVTGYGRFWDGRREWKAHVFAWVEQHGPVPEGLQLDHLCRVRRCVRPEHLEPVTARINTLRGATLPAANVQKTGCPAGHPYDVENTRIYRGRRHCRACDRARGNPRQRQMRRLKLSGAP